MVKENDPTMEFAMQVLAEGNRLDKTAVAILEGEGAKVTSFIADLSARIQNGFKSIGIEITPQRFSSAVECNLRTFETVLTAYERHTTEGEPFGPYTALGGMDISAKGDERIEEIRSGLISESFREESKIGLRLKNEIKWEPMAQEIAGFLVGVTQRALKPLRDVGAPENQNFDSALYDDVKIAFFDKLESAVSQENTPATAPAVAADRRVAPQ